MLPVATTSRRAGEPGQQMAVAEVRVLGDNHPTLLISQSRDPLIAAPVAVRKREGMEHVMTDFAEPGSEPDG